MDGRARKATTNTAACGPQGRQGTQRPPPSACSKASLPEMTESLRRGQYRDSPGFMEVSARVCPCVRTRACVCMRVSQYEKLYENGFLKKF